jgi:hypothetical protein
MRMKAKKPRPKYEDIVSSVVNLPQFNKAWVEVGDAGAANEEALRKVWELVSASDWHTRFLQSEMGDIMIAAGEWADTLDMEKDEITDPNCPTGAFAAQLLNQLRTIGAGYIVIGVMVGFFLASHLDEPTE